MWFRKEHPVCEHQGVVTSHAGFKVGQLVRHKATHARAVVVGIQKQECCIECYPVVAIGWAHEQEFGTTFAEIEAVELSEPLAKTEP